MSAPRPPRIEVEIGELVLRGFPAGTSGEAVAAAVRAELAALLEAGGVPPGWAAGGRVDPAAGAGVQVSIPAGAGAGAVGARIAEGIHRGAGGGDAPGGR